VPYREHVITQIATGMFRPCARKIIQRARIVSFKYAQGAKAGTGRTPVGGQATMAVAKMREAVPG